LAKKLIAIVLLLVAALALPAAASVGPPLGQLQGRVTDQKGQALAGVSLYVSSPALLGIRNALTSKTGHFTFLALPPGTYRVAAEMPGYKSLIFMNIDVRSGKVVELPLRLEASETEAESTRLGPAPLVDVRQAKTAVVFDADIIDRAPLVRDLAEVIKLAPGVVAEPSASPFAFSAHGSIVQANTYVVDGLDATDPLDGTLLLRLGLELVEEVEVVTAGHAADGARPGAGFVNVLLKSGADRMEGSLTVHHTSSQLAKSLWTTAELEEMGLPRPSIDQRYWDNSFTLGGPVLADRASFFLSTRLLYRYRLAPFQTWTDPAGVLHEPYSWSNTDLSGFFKVVVQATKEFKGHAEVGYSKRNQPVDEGDLSPFRPLAATRSVKDAGSFFATGGLHYLMNQDTFAEIGLGYVDASLPLRLNGAGQASARYFDTGTGYFWGSGLVNETTQRNRIYGQASITHFVDKALGARHELRAGGGFESSFARRSDWKENNLAIQYLFGSPYFYGLQTSPATGQTVGKGAIYFSVAPPGEDSFNVKQETRKLGIFVQDTLTIADRLTLTLGLRYDRLDARLPSFIKYRVGNDIAYDAGENLIKPLYGMNPFDSVSITGWDGVVTWNTFSPRLGFILDPFGRGRTALKASYADYADVLSLSYAQNLETVSPDRWHRFDWYDEDMDGLVGAEDTLELFPEDYRLYDSDFYQKRVDPDLSAPRTREFTLGLQHEIWPDFSLSATYIRKEGRNLIGDVLYDPDGNRAWYGVNAETAAPWIPFRTVVPDAGTGYGETPVTVYFPSAAAPAVFDRLQNVPELKRRYEALEFVLHKRLAGRWQLWGSAVWAKATGNAGLATPAALGLYPSPLDPNSLVNIGADAVLDLDRPFTARVLAGYRLPLGFDLTALFTHTSGAPWARTVTIFPPATWAAVRGARSYPVTVYLEAPGARRLGATNVLDARLERDFALGARSRLRVILDVLNLFGTRSRTVDRNDAGVWYPDQEGGGPGLRVLSSSFNLYQSALGTRVARVTLSLKF
jgi:Carboxypeptidase regulatory-like domain/TonB dependent receptor-like, beta-barrel